MNSFKQSISLSPQDHSDAEQSQGSVITACFGNHNTDSQTMHIDTEASNIITNEQENFQIQKSFYLDQTIMSSSHQQEIQRDQLFLNLSSKENASSLAEEITFANTERKSANKKQLPKYIITSKIERKRSFLDDFIYERNDSEEETEDVAESQTQQKLDKKMGKIDDFLNNYDNVNDESMINHEEIKAEVDPQREKADQINEERVFEERDAENSEKSLAQISKTLPYQDIHLKLEAQSINQTLHTNTQRQKLYKNQKSQQTYKQISKIVQFNPKINTIQNKNSKNPNQLEQINNFWFPSHILTTHHIKKILPSQLNENDHQPIRVRRTPVKYWQGQKIVYSKKREAIYEIRSKTLIEQIFSLNQEYLTWQNLSCHENKVQGCIIIDDSKEILIASNKSLHQSIYLEVKNQNLMMFVQNQKNIIIQKRVSSIKAGKFITLYPKRQEQMKIVNPFRKRVQLFVKVKLNLN